AGTAEVHVADHERIEVFDLEGGVVEARLAEADAEQRVVIDGNVAAVAAHERRDHILRVAHIDVVGSQEAEARLVPRGAAAEVRYTQNDMAQAFDARRPGGHALEHAEAAAFGTG